MITEQFRGDSVTQGGLLFFWAILYTPHDMANTCLSARTFVCLSVCRRLQCVD